MPTANAILAPTWRQRWELIILRHGADFGKIAIPLGDAFDSKEILDTHTGLVDRGWLRLVDVTDIEDAPPGKLFRIFMLSDEAKAFVEEHREVVL